MNNARILLTTPVNGYLDIKNDTAFPIQFSIGDIRDISKRNGAFSKTITLVGNKDNNNLLGHLYDTNSFEVYNINTLQECLVEQDGIVILDNMYLQLTSVNKVQKDGSHDYDIEYQCEVKDSTSDFFNKISNLELTDLDFSEFNNHTYTVDSVTQSFTHTWEDGYKYVLPWKNTSSSLNNADRQYQLNEMRPGVYVRQYWEKIFSNAGYSYTFDEMDNQDIEFSKLIIPYNGADVKIEDDIDLVVEAGITQSKSHFIYGGLLAFQSAVGSGGSNSPSQIILDDEITDINNQYNPTTGIFSPAFTISQPGVVTFNFTIDYDVELIAPTTITLGSLNGNLTSGSNIVKPGFILRNNTSGTEGVQYFNTTTIPIGSSYTSGTHTINTGSITFEMELSDLTTSTQIIEKLYLAVTDTTLGNGNGDNLVWKNGSGTVYYANYRLNITNIDMNIVPKDLSLDYNVPVTMNSFVPKKIKQSDFIKSISQMYNLYIEVDRDDVTNLIIKTRDKFYDDGEVVNWTKKLSKDNSQNLKFLPELSKKKLLLTYKQDKDNFNVGYYNNTNEVYGQIEYVFENEFVKDVDKKELIFSPTPMIYTNFDANTPAIEGFEPKNNIRILLDNGVKSCGEYFIEDINNYSINEYPFISHFSDNPNTPSFDINYGTCDYYYYNDYQITNNNLYNAHWRRTLGQINNGKLLSALFDLTSVDIQKLKLNDKIRIDNSYWYINKIIDYNANSDNLTKVELISVDDELVIPPFKRKITTKPNLGGTIVGPIINDGPGGGGPGGGIGNNPGPVGPIRPNVILSGVADVKGKHNYVNRNVHGDIFGDNNYVFGEFVNINGNNNDVKSNSNITGDDNKVGYGSKNIQINGSGNTVVDDVQNISVLGDNLSIARDDTFYSGNFQAVETVYSPNGIEYQAGWYWDSGYTDDVYVGSTGATGVNATGIMFDYDDILNESNLYLNFDNIYLQGNTFSTTPQVATYSIDNTNVDIIMNSDVLLVVTATNSVTVKLPTAVNIPGETRIIKDVSGNANTNNITIDGFLLQNIDNNLTYTMSINYESVTLLSDGDNWWVI